MQIIEQVHGLKLILNVLHFELFLQQLLLKKSLLDRLLRFSLESDIIDAVLRPYAFKLAFALMALKHVAIL